MSLIQIDTLKRQFLIDGNPIQQVEKIDIEITSFEAKVTLLIANCDIQFMTEAILTEQSQPINDET